MASPEDRSEEDHSGSDGGGDEESDSSSSDSSSLPAPLVQDRSVHGGSSVLESSGQNPSSSLLFNPNEKGTRKQKRCDYDSDDRSYDGLGFDYKRRYLATTARRDSLLPGTTKMVDFDHQGDKTWGSRLLFETLGDSEIDSLVGLATSQATPLPTSSQADNMIHNPQKQNPLLSTTFDAPLPPSHIDYIKSRIRKHILEPNSDEDEKRPERTRKRAKASSAESLLNDSAGVAMGMYLEEAITASLLPLAGLHVLRCRALADMESAETEFGSALARTVTHPITGENVELDLNNQIRWKEEESFQEWTIPPEEAILKLMEQGVLANSALYQFIPNASRFCGATQSDEAPNSNSSIDIASLAKMYKLNPNVFSANREIFDIFLPANVNNKDDEETKP